MAQGASPIVLEVVRIDKRKFYEKNGQTRQLVHLYGKLRNDDPDFPLFFVVFAPSTLPVIPGASFAVPLSGIRIFLGDTEDAFPVPSFLDKQLNKKIP